MVIPNKGWMVGILKLLSKYLIEIDDRAENYTDNRQFQIRLHFMNVILSEISQLINARSAQTSFRIFNK